MTRSARLVVPGLPHHVTQRGNRREAIFFEDGDQEIYRDLLAEQTRKARVEVWAYCLMPNHVHLVLAPEEGLGRAVGETHRRYTNFINARGRWTGHLFQSRFASVAMVARFAAIGILSTYSMDLAGLNAAGKPAELVQFVKLKADGVSPIRPDETIARQQISRVLNVPVRWVNTN